MEAITKLKKIGFEKKMLQILSVSTGLNVNKEEDTEAFDKPEADFTAPIPVFTNDEVTKAEEKIADEFLKSEEGNQSTYQVPDFSEQSNSYDRNQMMIDGTKRLFQMMEEERLSLSNLGQILFLFILVLA